MEADRFCIVICSRHEVPTCKLTHVWCWDASSEGWKMKSGTVYDSVEEAESVGVALVAKFESMMGTIAVASATKDFNPT